MLAIESILIAAMIILALLAHQGHGKTLKRSWLLYFCDFCFLVTLMIIAKWGLKCGNPSAPQVWVIVIGTVAAVLLTTWDGVHLFKAIRSMK